MRMDCGDEQPSNVSAPYGSHLADGSGCPRRAATLPIVRSNAPRGQPPQKFHFRRCYNMLRTLLPTNHIFVLWFFDCHRPAAYVGLSAAVAFTHSQVGMEACTDSSMELGGSNPARCNDLRPSQHRAPSVQAGRVGNCQISRPPCRACGGIVPAHQGRQPWREIAAWQNGVVVHC